MKEKYYPKKSRLEYLPPARQANPQGARVLGETSSDQECSTCNLAGRWFWQEKKRNPRVQPLLLSPRSISPHGGYKWQLTKTKTGTVHSEPSVKLAKATKNSETRCIPGISLHTILYRFNAPFSSLKPSKRYTPWENEYSNISQICFVFPPLFKSI